MLPKNNLTLITTKTTGIQSSEKRLKLMRLIQQIIFRYSSLFQRKKLQLEVKDFRNLIVETKTL